MQGYHRGSEWCAAMRRNDGDYSHKNSLKLLMQVPNPAGFHVFLKILIYFNRVAATPPCSNDTNHKEGKQQQQPYSLV